MIWISWPSAKPKTHESPELCRSFVLVTRRARRARPRDGTDTLAMGRSLVRIAGNRTTHTNAKHLARSLHVTIIAADCLVVSRVDGYEATGEVMGYSYLDLANDVLKSAPQPLTYQELWQAGVSAGLATKVQTTGKTPWQSLGAQMYVEVRDNLDSRFVKIGKRPARFFLRERQKELPPDVAQRIEKEEVKKPEPKTSYKERDLHPLLAYFAYASPSFNRGRSIVTKTIFHERSSKPGYNEWVYPDMVGFYLPLEDWRPNVIELNRLSDNNSLKLFSFELKRSLNKASYREAFFQAVSNSSWAHEGYFVAAEVLQDDDLLAELERLASSFRIGVLHLDPHDVDSSTMLYPAKQRELLDWETINKLCEQNPDFDKFLQDVKIDFEGRRIHRSEYDEVIKDVPKYVEEHLSLRLQ